MGANKYNTYNWNIYGINQRLFVTIYSMKQLITIEME